MYRETWRRRIKKQQHANVSELQSYVVEEKRIANSKRSCRFLVGMDSQVGLGEVVRGRAASACLNAVLQPSMPDAISGDVYSCPMYFNTASNRADAPTKERERERERVSPPPDLLLPPWFAELDMGEFASFDA